MQQTGTAPEASTGQVVETRRATEIDERVVASTTDFAFRLFGELLNEGPGSHRFVSPSTIASVLTLACSGASGETRQAMIGALQLEGIDWEDAIEANAGLRAALLSPDPKVQLDIASALCLQESRAFRQEFIDASRSFHGAKLARLDFTAPDAYRKVNEWVREQTNGSIKAIIPYSQPKSTMLLVVNALHFRGQWAEPFDPEETADGPFTLPGGTRVALPMMSRRGAYPYLETDAFQAIGLPYGEGKLSLYVFLPAPDISLVDFCRTLTAEQWDSWMSEFEQREGTIKLPRFSLEYSTDLRNALEALGMGIAFDPDRADFSNMVEEGRAWIDSVELKTLVDVIERGTGAPTAAIVGMGEQDAPATNVEPFGMTVDRPFFCAIRDNETGSILLMGVVVDPEAHLCWQRLWPEEE